LVVQTICTGYGLSVHHITANIPDTSVQKVSRLVADRNGDKGTAYDTIHHIHLMLFHLLLSDERDEYATVYGQHSGGGTGDTDGMRTDQCLVEDFHTYGSHRGRGGSIDSFLADLRV
jgi:hypothetical protein